MSSETDAVPLAGSASATEQRGPTPEESLAQKVARSAANLVAGRGAVTLLSAIATVAITRLLGPTGYGVYGSVVAVSAVLGAAADLGISLMLSRDMAQQQANQRALLKSAYQVAGVWSSTLAGLMVVLAFAASLSSDRGVALLVLAPSMAFNGLNPARSLFLVTYRTRALLKIDVTTLGAQIAIVIAVAAIGLGPIGVCAVVSVGTILNSLVIAVVAERMLPSTTDRFGRLELIRRSLPLGMISIMTRVYLTLDLVLLGWYIKGPRLGDYAAASKLLTVLAGIAGTVMSGALPALSSIQADREQFNAFVARVWHWLIMLGIPIFIGLALFAPIVVDLTLGPRYHAAVALTRILCIAGGVTVISNLVGSIQVAKRRTKQLVGQNLIAIIVNVAGNLLLIPRYGVYAAAWMTTVTEVAVCCLAILSLRGDLDFRRLVRTSGRPLSVIAVATVLVVPLVGSQYLALVGAILAFFGGATIARAWPPELTSAVSRRAASNRGHQ